MTSPDPGPPALDRLRRLARWRTPPPRVRAVLLGVAALVFVIGVVLSLAELDLTTAELTLWPLLVVAVVATPATIAVNAAELRAMARTLGPSHHLGAATAVRTVVVATAANVLPLPGGALVRIHALVGAGASAARATAINLVAAVVWVATAVLLAGIAGLGFRPAVGGLAIAAGVVGVALGGWAARVTATGFRVSAFLGLVLVEVVTTLVHAARLWLVLLALGVGAGAREALVLGVAAPLAAAAGVFPSGLGLAELLTALLAPLVALPAAAGFAATAVARVVGLAATAPIALILGLRDALPSVEQDTRGPSVSDEPERGPGTRRSGPG